MDAFAANGNAEREYYHLIESILKDSIEAQITSLQNFIRTHPTCERAYLKLLERYIVQSRTTAAVTYFREIAVLPAYRRNGNWILAKLFTMQDDSAGAITAFQDALRGDAPSTLLLKDVVECLHQLEMDDGATVLRQVELPANASKLLTTLFDVVHLRDDQAIRSFQEGFDKFSGDVAVLDLLGNCYFRLCRFADAERIWKLGLERSHLNGDLEFEGRFLCNLGLLSARMSGGNGQAQIYADSARVIANRLDDWRLQQLIAGHSAYALICRRDYVGAIKLYQYAISLASRLALADELSTWYYRCGQAFYFSRQYPEALRAFEQSEVFALRANSGEVLFLTWLGKGDLYFNLGQHALARRTFQDAYDLIVQRKWSNRRYLANACMRLADLMAQEGRYEKAIKIYRRIIDLQPWEGNFVESAYWLGRLANAYSRGGYDKLAHATYLQAYETATRAEARQYMPWYLIKAAQIELGEGNTGSAIQKCMAAAEIDTSKNNRVLWVELYLTLGDAYKKSGDVSQAISNYLRAVSTIEDTRQAITVEDLRMGYFSRWQEVYRLLVQCFYDRYLEFGNRADLDSLCFYKEMSLSRALQDMRVAESSDASAGGENESDTKYQNARQQLQLMQHRIRRDAEKLAHTDEWDRLCSQLEAARYSLITRRLQLLGKKSHAGLRRTSPSDFVSKMIRDVPEGYGLMAFHIADEGSFVLVATNESVRLVPLPVRPTTVAATVDSLMTPLHAIEEKGGGRVPFRASLAHRLYQLLIKPAEMAVELPQKLLVVPDLVLMNLPFEMLLVAAPDKPEYLPADDASYAKNFLLNRHIVIYTPNLAVLQEKPRPIARNPKMLILADPFGGAPTTAQKAQFRFLTGWRFDALPFSEVEALKIAETYPSTQVYTQSTARKSVFIREAPRQDILHVATHAFVDTTFDIFSGLVLAAGADSTDDGMLMGYEIADLRLNCDLVTLSACETGRGRLVAGEGVLGLPRQFLGAGAKSVLMTLWKVDDKFASELMPEFYKYFLKEKLSKAEALARAKRAIIGKYQADRRNSYEHPFYWASFVLYGDPGIGGESEFSASPLSEVFTVISMCLIIVAIYRWLVHRSQKTKINSQLA